MWVCVCVPSPETIGSEETISTCSIALSYTFSYFFIISVWLLSAATLLSLAPDNVIWAPFLFNLFWLLQIHQSDSRCLWYSFIYIISSNFRAVKYLCGCWQLFKNQQAKKPQKTNKKTPSYNGKNKCVTFKWVYCHQVKKKKVMSLVRYTKNR